VIDASRDAIARGHFDAALLTNSFRARGRCTAFKTANGGAIAPMPAAFLTCSVSRLTGARRSFHQHLVAAWDFQPSTPRSR
jgi:hypothetical protein